MRRITLVALLPLTAIACSDDVSGPSGNTGVPGLPSVGDPLALNVPADVDDPCEATPDEHEGVVVAVTSNTIVVVDTENPPSGLSDEEYVDIAGDFDAWGYPVVTQYFGEPSDVDENERVIAFFTRAVNEYTKDGDDGFVFGLFWPGDLFQATGNNACATSNYAEVLYLAVPDPGGDVGLSVTQDAIRNTAASTMGHELQHLVNASRRLYVSPTAPAFETIWLNEGLSHAAEELMFFERTGAEPGTNIDIEWLRDGPDCVSPAGANAPERICAFNQFQIQNFTRFANFLEDPDTSAASLLNTEGTLASRGSDWHFLRYAADRHGAEADFWWDLVNTDLNGLPNLTQAIGTDPETWIRDWSAAVYADDEAVDGEEFGFPSWDMRSIYPAFQDENDEQIYPEYPLTVHELTDAAAVDVDVAGMAVAYVQVDVPPTGTATVTVTLPAGAGAPPAQLQLSVINTSTGAVAQHAGDDAAEVTLEGGASGARYVLAALNASTNPDGTLGLRFESEGAGAAAVANAASRDEALLSRGSFPLSAAMVPMPAVNHRFHVEFLERAQRHLTPRIAQARRVYNERQRLRDLEQR